MKNQRGLRRRKELHNAKLGSTYIEHNFYYKLLRLQNFCQSFYDKYYEEFISMATSISEIPFMNEDFYYFTSLDEIVTADRKFYTPKDYIAKAKNELREAIESFNIKQTKRTR
ncbi:hypothetical protein EHQ23_09035 [Leptospira bourretii]|uniref:Uncharacterized protein n=1 Tax=Leptospira bourretii TaxID=2484962 RepID=A0A4R9IKZ0_9LEPT|nr:hypothetical protein [Leptospira bourretii]TGK84830.1 hypothetical protein EHQ23_09035 [Leptospira bourretii]TGK90597.1 hypothetical protein EHQ26_10635 [Leptospira bourretii]